MCRCTFLVCVCVCVCVCVRVRVCALLCFTQLCNDMFELVFCATCDVNVC